MNQKVFQEVKKICWDYSNWKLLKNDLTLLVYIRRDACADKDKHEAADDKQDDGDNIKASSSSSRAPTITSSVVAPVNNLR